MSSNDVRQLWVGVITALLTAVLGWSASYLVSLGNRVERIEERVDGLVDQINSTRQFVINTNRYVIQQMLQHSLGRHEAHELAPDPDPVATERMPEAPAGTERNNAEHQR